uniref:SCP2 domain-containing protein n=1 Tax=Chrysotila carterae TaxID=13221 RepID=A0A7S4C210_CHRCT
MASGRVLHDVFEYINGMPCPEGCGEWTARCDIGSEPICWILVSDGETIRVQEVGVSSGVPRPEVEMSAYYHSARLFVREVRGLLTEQAQAAEFVKGRIRIDGDREKALELAQLFRSLGPQLQQIASKHAEEAAEPDEPPPSPVLRLLIALVVCTRKAVRALRAPLSTLRCLGGNPDAHAALLRDRHSHHHVSLAAGGRQRRSLLLAHERQRSDRFHRASIVSDESDACTVEEVLAALPWYRRHFGTDLLVAAWLWLLGCALYAIVSVSQLVAAPTDAKLWLDLLSSLLFVVACVALLFSSYPTHILKLAEDLARPPRDLTCIETFFTSNLMLLTTQLFIIGTLPYMAEAAVRVVESDVGSFEYLLGWGMLLGLTALMPLLLFWSFIAMDFNLRKNNGRGSSYIFDFCAKMRCCHALNIRDKTFWRKHVGCDSLCTMWIMGVLACVCETAVVGKLILFPDAFTAFLAIDGAILTVGMLLMLHAVYPENFNSSSIFKDPHPAPNSPRPEHAAHSAPSANGRLMV